MIEAAFFDVDGTLLSFTTHDIPSSTRRALAALRDAGVALYVATGRSLAMLPEAVRSGFDGYITVNGQVCFDADGEFRRQRIEPEGVRRVVDRVRAGAFDALFMTEGRSFVSGKGERVRDNERHVGLCNDLGDPDEALDLEILQMCAFVAPRDEHLVTDDNPYVTTARWCDDFCDIMPQGGGKPAGVRALRERHRIDIADTAAFGVGGNDIALLRCAGIGVAMGNAGDDVKAAADYVTTDVDDDGIWNACRALGLL